MDGPFLMICDGFCVVDVMSDNIVSYPTQVFHSFENLAAPVFQRTHICTGQSWQTYLCMLAKQFC